MPAPVFLEHDYAVIQVDPSTWEDHGGSHGVYSYACYWEGIPGRSRLLMRVPRNIAHHVTGVGGFSRVEDA